MSTFKEVSDDKFKVTPLASGDDEYEPEPGDIPIEYRREDGNHVSQEHFTPKGAASVLRPARVVKFLVTDDHGEPMKNFLYKLFLPSGRCLYGERRLAQTI